MTEYQPSPAYAAPRREQPYRAASVDPDEAIGAVPTDVVSGDYPDPHKYPQDEEPTPVVIVERSPRPFTRHLNLQTFTATADTPIKVVGNAYVRRKVKLTNVGAGDVIVGSHSGVTRTTGYVLLASGANPLESETTDDLWVVAEADSSVSVAEEREYPT